MTDGLWGVDLDAGGRELAPPGTGISGCGWHAVGVRVVTLCGSMRFWPLMVQVAATETTAGVVVLAPFVIVASREQYGTCAGLTARLDALHRVKIDMSSSVVVVTDRSGYWGESTCGEIDYAVGLGRPVRVRVVDAVTGEQSERGPVTGSGGWWR